MNACDVKISSRLGQHVLAKGIEGTFVKLHSALL